MNIDNKYINELGGAILGCDDLVNEEWELCAYVFNVNDGHTSNSGFLYSGDSVMPSSTKTRSNRLLISDKVLELREAVFQECGHKYKQLLVQLEKETGRFKIDFEFDDPDRWNIVSDLEGMKQKLKPEFS